MITRKSLDSLNHESMRYYGYYDAFYPLGSLRTHGIESLASDNNDLTWLELKDFREDAYLAAIFADYRLSLKGSEQRYSWGMSAYGWDLSPHREEFRNVFLRKHEGFLKSYGAVVSPERELALRASGFAVCEILAEQLGQYGHREKVSKLRAERWRSLSDNPGTFHAHLKLIEEIASILIQLMGEGLVQPSELIEQWLSIHDELVILNSLSTAWV